MDDDEFLYGSSSVATSEPKPIALDQIAGVNGVVAHLEAEANKEDESNEQDTTSVQEADDSEADEESEDDVEFIMETPVRKLDFRQNRPQPNRSESTSTPKVAPAPSTLTTEYTPMARGEASASAPMHPPQPPSVSTPTTLKAEPAISSAGGPDPSTLPPVTAPPSHPEIDPTAVGVLDGRSILEVDINALAEKPWRRPGADLSDWFNYGFDELSWEAYCYRRRDVGDLGTALKQNVINFAGMPEEQIAALPMEIRQMVMTGATAMGANPGMMAPGMNPMMDMNMMNPMSMGMNGEMAMHAQMQQMQDGRQMFSDNHAANPMATIPTEPNQQIMQEGFVPGGPSGGMMNMGIGGDFTVQDTAAMSQQPHPTMESNIPTAPQIPQQPAAQRAAATAATNMPFRGRGQIPTGPSMRGPRGAFPGRGRGRGTPVPVRPASPLPPGVPTGPRNQNKYKDRDNNGPAVDGLDYGGGKDPSRPHSGEPEERSSSRKRRGSPGVDDPRGSKRR